MTIISAGQRSIVRRLSVFIGLSCVVLFGGYAALSVGSLHQGDRASVSGGPSAADEAAESHELIAFFEARSQRDPDDAVVYTKLAGLYLEQLRETGALDDLARALRAARRSLAIVPGVRNTEGLTYLAMAEFASHDFRSARDHALQLEHLEGSSAPYALLGDALSELGQYGPAEAAYKQMQQRTGGIDENVATRMARLAQLRGDSRRAEQGFRTALGFELSRSVPSRERIAWFRWQLGDTAFLRGDYSAAQTEYEEALSAYPGYFRALASLGRLDAARGSYSDAIRNYESAVRTLPDPTFVGELGDVYALAGRPVQAAAEYGLVAFIGHLSRLNGVMYNRQIAMFYADHDIHANEAYLDARREYAVRQDILGADALAWTALKAGKLPEAQAAMTAALRLGTLDPRLLYHAGMIARARGQRAAATKYLRAALALCPQFDPLQASAARHALEN